MSMLSSIGTSSKTISSIRCNRTRTCLVYTSRLGLEGEKIILLHNPGLSALESALDRNRQTFLGRDASGTVNIAGRSRASPRSYV